ncbi:Hypp2165 [Branchiostoma lanceolatum]|uniref:Hypp2165 protein n=1 Tax=Branchiostoma lanceolatum TaxID=7740 RepID=A0A8J9ZP69_BRALA|nr:Hypp2165 [Branchiostoma lanceolatum]
MLLLEKISLVAILGLCILSLRVGGQGVKRGCSAKNIKKNYRHFAKIGDRVKNVLRLVRGVSEKVDDQVSREDRASLSLLLPKVGDLHFDDSLGFSGLRLKGLKLADAGLDDIEMFQIYMAEMEALLNELNRVKETVVDDVIETLSHVTEDKLSVLEYLKEELPILQEYLKEVHEDASELMGKIKTCVFNGETNVDELIEQYKTQIESARPTVATRARRDTQEAPASSPILLRKIRSLVGSQAPGTGERILQHSQWVLQDLQNLLQHDVISTLDSMANRRGKRGRGQGREEGGKRSD